MRHLGWLGLLACTAPTERGPHGSFRDAVEQDIDAEVPDGALRAVTLTVDQVIPGDVSTFTLTGAAANELVHFARTSQGLGLGPCFGTAGTFCLDINGPIALQGSENANNVGVAILVQTIPEIAPIGADLWFQGVIPRGASGLGWVKTNVVQLTVEDAALTVPAMSPGDLIITEVMVDPLAVADARGEWFEVYNASGLDANLDGLVISDGINSFTVQGTTFLADGDWLVFGVESDTLLNGGLEVDRETPGLSLANQWGEVALTFGATLIDFVGWDDGASFPVVAGHSLTLAEDIDHIDNDIGQNWCTSAVPYGLGDLGTPGGFNDSCDSVVIDIDFVDLESDADARFIGEDSTDESGRSVSHAGDVNGDGLGDILVGTRFSGNTYLIHGPVVGDLDLSLADARLIGENLNDNAGYSVAGAGDVNGDGFDDILVGAHGNDDNATDAGATYLVHGPVVGDLDLSLADARLLGERVSDLSGFAVAAAGDVDGDGFDDILVGAPEGDGVVADSGVAYLVSGPIAGDVNLANADARLLGEVAVDNAGYHVAGAGDVNGDGFDDILIGAPFNDDGGPSAGKVYLVHGPVVGDIDLSSADASFVGENISDEAGTSIAGVGDVNGDGFDDILIGAPLGDVGGIEAGTSYLVYGPVSGTVDLANADARLIGDSLGDAAGVVSGAGDVNGDGFADLLIGAWSNDEGASNAGTAYLVHGPVSGDVGLANADVRMVGNGADDHAGRSVSGGGDINGDGYSDILVGADRDDAGGPSSGSTYLVHGGPGL